VAGSEGCRPCLAGSFSTAVGAVDATVCAQCPSQTFAEAGASGCTDCLWDGFSSIGASRCVRDPTYTVTVSDEVFATIWNDDPASAVQRDIGCGLRHVPEGWIIPGSGGTSQAVAAASPWQATYLIMNNGRAWTTAIHSPKDTLLLNQLRTDEVSDPWGLTLYGASQDCTHRVLIQRCPSGVSLTAVSCAP